MLGSLYFLFERRVSGSLASIAKICIESTCGGFASAYPYILYAEIGNVCPGDMVMPQMAVFGVTIRQHSVADVTNVTKQ